MKWEWNWKIALQVANILVAALVISGFIYSTFMNQTFQRLSGSIICCVLLIGIVMADIYVLTPFRYFGFLLKLWGRGFVYILSGCIIFDHTNALRLICSIFSWIVGIGYIVLQFTMKRVPLPLAQKEIPSLTATEQDYFPPY